MATFEQCMRARASPMYCLMNAYFIAALLVFLWVIFMVELLINYSPSYFVQNFYVPALNKFINKNYTTMTEDSLIFFDLELQNPMNYKGVHYDVVDLTCCYATNTTSCIDIGTYTVPGFYQGEGKIAQRRDVAVVTGKVPWQETATATLSNGSSTVGFRMRLATKVKFKWHFLYWGEWIVSVGGRVEVDDSGKKLEKKPVCLNSGL